MDNWVERAASSNVAWMIALSVIHARPEPESDRPQPTPTWRCRMVIRPLSAHPRGPPCVWSPGQRDFEPAAALQTLRMGWENR